MFHVAYNAGSDLTITNTLVFGNKASTSGDNIFTL